MQQHNKIKTEFLAGATLIGVTIVILSNLGAIGGKSMKVMVIVVSFFAMAGGEVHKLDEKAIGGGKVTAAECQETKARLENQATVLRKSDRKDLEFPKMWAEYSVECK